tara:strand:- start:2458 stop:2982 length:525 start_codon:yes stop_codon:yes gene_type:complete
MKYIVRFIVVTFFLFVSTHALTEEKVVVLNLKFVLNNSKAGKSAQDFLQKKFSDDQKKFADEEAQLKKEESDLLANKANISKEEYKKKSEALRSKVAEYQNKRRTALDTITRQRADARKKLLDTVNPILNKYVDENNISLVIDSKNVLAGKNDLNITEIIIDKLNKELPSLNLK